MIPTNDKERKALPLYDGTFGYFPLALIEVARVSKIGNDQHNPGQPLHWAREKSTDQINTAMRHLVDHQTGVVRDTDATYHLGKAIWRLCAELQLLREREIEHDAGRSNKTIEQLAESTGAGAVRSTGARGPISSERAEPTGITEVLNRGWDDIDNASPSDGRY